MFIVFILIIDCQSDVWAWFVFAVNWWGVFFGFVYFCLSVGWVFAVDKIAVGALLFCYKNYT